MTTCNNQVTCQHFHAAGIHTIYLVQHIDDAYTEPSTDERQLQEQIDHFDDLVYVYMCNADYDPPQQTKATLCAITTESTLQQIASLTTWHDYEQEHHIADATCYAAAVTRSRSKRQATDTTNVTTRQEAASTDGEGRLQVAETALAPTQPIDAASAQPIDAAPTISTPNTQAADTSPAPITDTSKATIDSIPQPTTSLKRKERTPTPLPTEQLPDVQHQATNTLSPALF